MTQPATPKTSDIEVAPKLGAIQVSERGVSLRTYEDVMRFATSVIQSGLAPASFKTPQAVLVAIQTGAELGFTPMRALSAIAVVNGRPSLMGDAMLALIRKSGVCLAEPIIDVRGQGDAREGFIHFQRKTMPQAVDVAFSVADAKRAGLWGKAGPWTQYPDAMLRWRAVGVASKLYFSDVAMGITIAEEAQDYPAIETARPEGHTPARSPQSDPLLLDATAPAGANEGTEIPATLAGAVDEPPSPLDEKGVCKTCERHVETYGHQNGCPDAPQ